MRYIDKWLILFIFMGSFRLGFPLRSENFRSNNNKTAEETTTALPKYTQTAPSIISNVTSSATNPSSSTASSKSTTQQPNESTTKNNSTTPSGGSYYTSTFVESSRTTNEKDKLTSTTAIPLTARSSEASHKFDSLSFMGGCLFTICLITVGVLVWKMYEARLERNYLTI